MKKQLNELMEFDANIERIARTNHALETIEYYDQILKAQAELNVRNQLRQIFRGYIK